MKKNAAYWLLRTLGWRLEGTKPLDARYVLIAAPHTSNWDFPLMLLFASAFDIKMTWMAKHSLFWWPLSWFLLKLGGMPVQRDRKTNLVDTMVDCFEKEKSLVLVVPTEGTRARAEHWKSGFYYIATRAGVPIVPSFLDFGQKRGGFGPAMMPSGKVSEDMQYFRDFYADMTGKFPALFGPIRLRDEDKADP